jgi:hypothetical protein
VPKSIRRSLPILLLLAASCGDSVGPGDAASLAIEHEAQRLRDATLLVGDSLNLTLTFRVGGRPSTPRDVRWSSTNPAVAAVNADGVVRALAAGGAQVIASASSVADTVNLTVFDTVGEGCGGGAGLQLSVGQALVTTGAAAPRLCLEGGPGGAEFVLIPFHASSAAGTLGVEFTGVGLGFPRSTVQPLMDTHAHTLVMPEGPGVDVQFDRRLREREARELTPLIRGAGGLFEGPRADVVAASVPQRGEVLTLNVNAKETCTNPVNRQARVMEISQRAIILADVQNPTGGFTDADYRAFAKDFDELVHPTVVGNFGEPTDIDANGRVMVLFTSAVNEMTTTNSDSYVAGFFYGRDLFPKSDQTGFRGCAASNSAELLYMLVPDPNGTINGNRRSREFVRDRTVGVLAHELQHLINASRRLRVVRTQNWSEEFWLNEGLSHIAEELVFYAATPWSARQNLPIDVIRANTSGLNAFNQYQVTNAARLSGYMRRPESASPINGTDLPTRGAIWGFLRYAADRRSGSESEFWRRLIDAQVTGYDNLAGALQASPMDWMQDWVVSLYTDDFIAVPVQYTQPSWHSRSILPALSSNAGSYPLRVQSLTSGEANRVRVDLVGGGSAFLRLAVRAGQQGEVVTTSGGATAPSRLRMTIVRTR